MNLEKWTNTTGEIPIMASILLVNSVSLILAVLIYQFNPSWALISGLGFGISGWILVIIPNMIMLRRIMNDEKPKLENDSHD